MKLGTSKTNHFVYISVSSDCVPFPVSLNCSFCPLSKAIWFCFFHRSEYKLWGFAINSKWLPCSATCPFCSTKIKSASTTVESLWAMTIVVLFFVTLRSASRIFWKEMTRPLIQDTNVGKLAKRNFPGQEGVPVNHEGKCDASFCAVATNKEKPHLQEAYSNGEHACISFLETSSFACLLYLFRYGVEWRCRFIVHQDGRILQNGPSNRHSLLFATCVNKWVGGGVPVLFPYCLLEMTNMKVLKSLHLFHDRSQMLLYLIVWDLVRQPVCCSPEANWWSNCVCLPW